MIMGRLPCRGYPFDFTQKPQRKTTPIGQKRGITIFLLRTHFAFPFVTSEKKKGGNSILG